MNSMETQQPRELLAERYQLLRPIGQGGMAEVFHARDINLQRQVALKILKRDFIEDEAFKNRFLQEARAAANLLHPNIVTVYDFGQDEDKYFIVMEFVAGKDLKTLLRRQGPLPIDLAVNYMIQICSGVGYAHRAGLVHCDLKPHNMLVTSDQRVKITDFGIARALAAIKPDEHHDIVWGSPLYFSPEQAAGKPPSPASDVYSLGVVFYEMVTGRPPFTSDDSDSLIRMHQTKQPTSPRIINPHLPTALEQIIFKVLSKEPSARYRTADQLGRVLETYQEEQEQFVFSPEPAAPEAFSPAQEEYGQTLPFPEAETGTGIDWLAVALGLLAFLAVGGLIPVWLYACLLYPSCPLSLP
jgi:serine/threonine-protein kinase